MHRPDDLDPEKVIDPNKAFNLGDTILEKWRCSKAQKSVILDIDPQRYEQFSARSADCELNDEQLERISHIANIHAALRTLFSNPENVNGFMSLKNSNAFFNGKSPLTLVESGDTQALCRVTQHVTSMLHD